MKERESVKEGIVAKMVQVRSIKCCDVYALLCSCLILSIVTFLIYGAYSENPVFYIVFLQG